MKGKIFVPPIKIQGIKTKLVKWIMEQINFEIKGRWVEPFMGSGVVGFNVQPKQAVFADKNPHIINFYNAIKTKEITSKKVELFLKSEGEKLLRKGEEYYYEVRDRFNKYQDPLDFLFLNRSCFNGVIRFNSKGEFNTPFGKNPNRFKKAYITKIVNQVRYVEELIHKNDWIFIAQDFRVTITEAKKDDLIYCDPPYIGRHTNYFDIWTEKDEYDLYKLLSHFEGKFILSTWYRDKRKENEYIKKFWSKFKIITKNHLYYVGGKEINRNPVVEALVINFEPS
ncbi:MAG: DNA adenine methylase [Minisyncoccia bacterium]|jgi:DNA adenine methylase